MAKKQHTNEANSSVLDSEHDFFSLLNESGKIIGFSEQNRRTGISKVFSMKLDLQTGIPVVDFSKGYSLEN